ncbi:3-hydroxybutyryl-CoA dehydrogenase [Micromonospora orduensis]|uniref:3-hydroxybutyryl-CoA dehydrogenase n=1 Tax=Micromonospora orduensis TaxID=1420891 RepID=A0A5C4QLE1_9ACTN|nr:3-hydroxybutyryl-CoA dehydrogenase [Micromonospora orduensis]TNH27634.1 3-hydroxybutyryl-CoA dehydrogenase [Micromonospora orduensis]
MNSIRKVGVVGCGVMGTGIAEACAVAGLDVRVVTSSPLSVPTARERLSRAVDRRVRKGKLDSARRDDILDAITVSAQLDCLADRDLVVEAVTERESAKMEVFAALNKIVANPDAVLASNTSSIPVGRLARATDRPERVLGVHFFNPVAAMPLVELVGALRTDPETISLVERFATGVLGKQVIRVGDRAGFVVNALLVPYLLNAIRMLEAGYASAQDIDRAMTLGCGHPMGPLALVDLIGLDTVAAIAAALHEEFGEPSYAPPPLLRRMVEAGWTGGKAGRGFHSPS